MNRLTGAVLRHRRWVVLGWVAIVVAGMWAAATINSSLSRSFDAPGRPAFAANREIVRVFKTGGVVAPIVLVTAAGEPAAVERRLQRVARAVPGARVALPSDPGGQVLVSPDGRIAAALVFPQPGRPAPDANPEGVAALTRASAGTGVSVTGVDALAQATQGCRAGGWASRAAPRSSSRWRCLHPLQGVGRRRNIDLHADDSVTKAP